MAQRITYPTGYDTFGLRLDRTTRNALLQGDGSLTVEDLGYAVSAVERLLGLSASSTITSTVMERLTFLESSSPAARGSDTQVQFNDGGALAGNAGLTFNKSTSQLTVGGALAVGKTAPTTGYQFGVSGGIETNGGIRCENTLYVVRTAGGYLSLSYDTNNIYSYSNNLHHYVGAASTGKSLVFVAGGVGVGSFDGTTGLLSATYDFQVVGGAGFNASGETAHAFLGNSSHYIRGKYGTGIEQNVPTSSYYSWYVNTSEVMRLNTSGKLALGTVSDPSQFIHIKGATAYGQIQIESQSATAEASIGFKGSAETDASACWLIGKYITSGGDFQFYINGAVQLSLTDSGTLTFPRGGTVTNDPPSPTANATGWKLTLYGTGYAIGVAASTMYFKSGSLFSFSTSNAANSGSPDTNANFTIDGLNGGWYADGKCYEYNDIVTEGWGLPAIHDYFTYDGRTDQTHDCSNGTAAGFYRLSITVQTSGIDLGSSTVAIKYRIYHSNAGSQTITLQTLTLTNAALSSWVICFYHAGTQAIQAIFDYTSVGPSDDNYRADVTLERLA